jgi:hypothetical protein
MRSAIGLLAALLLIAFCVLGQPPAPKSELQKAVEEFKVQTRSLGLRLDSPPRARQGAKGKARWHGRIFENWRNDALDAVPHEIVQGGTNKSLLRRNQFGFNVSGPLVIPKLYEGGRGTYFSISYEGVREGISKSYLRTIASEPERTGDFSSVVDQAGVLLPIYDPATTQPNPNYDSSKDVDVNNLQYLRDPFPNNTIPSARLDTMAKKIVDYYPHPNIAVGPFLTNNYFVVAPAVNTANGMISKLDQTIRDRHRITLGLSFSNGFAGAAHLFSNGANPGASDQNYQNKRGYLEHVFTASPHTVNTFTVDVSTSGSNTSREGGTNYPQQLGFTGVSGTDFPVIYFDSYLNLGRANPTTVNARDTYTWTDSFSHRHGKHSFRVTGQLSKVQVDTYYPSYPSSYLSFGAGLTSLPGISDTGRGFATFLLGGASSGGVTFITSPSYFRRSTQYLAMSDQYEIVKGLNVSLSIGMIRVTPRTEKYDRQTTASLTATNPANNLPGALVVANRNGMGRSFYPATLHVDSSVGIAWNVLGDPKTVARASFGRSYGSREIYFGQFGTQGFNINRTYLSDNSQLTPALQFSTGIPVPAYSLPDLRGDAMNDSYVDLIDASDNVPVYQSAGLSVEREFPGSVLLTMGGYYSGGRNLFVGDGAVNPNAIPLAALQYQDALNEDSFRSQLRPYPQYRGFQTNGLYPAGRYQRDAAYMRVDKRTSQGLSLNFSYEFSKQMDDYSGPYGKQDFFHRESEWAMTAGANPHRVTLTWMYELPIGHNKPFLAASDWRRYLFDGWSVSGSTTFISGDPIMLRPEYNNTGSVVQALRVNVVPGVDPSVSHPGPNGWFNAAAFDQPADFTIGDGPRTHPTLRNPNYQNHDVSLTKRFSLAPDRTLEVSAVGLNFLNHANWNQPDPAIGPASAPNVNAGKITGSTGGRVIQLGARISF